jgi:aspartate/methionine/tyrosine aminotransferase
VADTFFWRKLLVRTGLARYVPSMRHALAGAEGHFHRYSDRTLAVPLAELTDNALLPDVSTPDSINLALGCPPCELPFGTGRGLHDRRLPSAWGDAELRNELAARFRHDHGAEHDPAEEVLVTHGATGAFAAVLDAFITPGDRVALFDPTSPIFPIGLKHRRAKVAWVRTWSDEGRLRFAMDVLARSLRGAKLLVLSDPANPSGCVFAPEDLEQIAFWSKKHDVLIYQDASFDRWRSEPPRTRLASLPHVEGRILTAGSFAKSHGLAAARVGWLVGHRHLLRPCAAAAMLSAPFVPSLCQQVALQALRTTTKPSEDFNARREFVMNRLRKMGLDPWEAGAGYFVWMPVPEGESGRDFAQRLLAETGVLVNPGAPFGPSGAPFIRISFATDEGRLREGLNRLQRFLATEVAACGVAISDATSA